MTLASAVEPITLERAAVARNALLNTGAFFPIILIAGSILATIRECMVRYYLYVFFTTKEK